ADLRLVPHIGPKLSEEFFTALRKIDLDGEIEQLARHEVGLLLHGTPEYPATLAEIADPPPILYVKGALQPQDASAVAIVGSRHCTAYGRRVAERLAGDVVRAGFTVISGLARGIDGAAHRGALQVGGRTVAVLAGGLSKVYPPEHADLAREIQAARALLPQ